MILHFPSFVPVLFLETKMGSISCRTRVIEPSNKKETQVLNRARTRQFRLSQQAAQTLWQFVGYLNFIREFTRTNKIRCKFPFLERFELRKRSTLVWVVCFTVSSLNYFVIEMSRVGRVSKKHKTNLKQSSTTVERPCATTSLSDDLQYVSDHLLSMQKHQHFPLAASQSLTVGTSRKRPTPASSRDHFRADGFIFFYCFNL